jgi:hypothetical protein
MALSRKQLKRKLKSKIRHVRKRAAVNGRKLRRKVKRKSKVALRIGKRIGRRQAKKAVRRLRKTGGFARRLARSGPKKLIKRWAKRKIRGAKRGRVMASTKRASFKATHVRRDGRHDIVPGRTIVEWRTRPEAGRGRVLAYLSARDLDVEFEQGGRPPSGVPIEEVRVLA